MTCFFSSVSHNTGDQLNTPKALQPQPRLCFSHCFIILCSTSQQSTLVAGVLLHAHRFPDNPDLSEPQLLQHCLLFSSASAPDSRAHSLHKPSQTHVRQLSSAGIGCIDLFIGNENKWRRRTADIGFCC